MKHAYLIMAHNEEELLKMLLGLLDGKDNDFYVHLDKRFKVNTKEIESIVKESKIHFIKRKRIFWGGYSQIHCELALLEEATKRKYDYYHLITGVDLPIKSNEEIDKFFETNKGKEFISFDKNANETRNFVRTYDKFHFFVRYAGKNSVVRILYMLCNIFLRGCATILNFFVKSRSKKYSDLIFMKGSAYFDITHNLAIYILKQKHLIKKLFRFTVCCDEVFLHTMAYNSSFKENITFTGTRYIDWSKHGSSPTLLTINHYNNICRSKHLYARKFSNTISRELIKKLYGDN